MENSFTFRYEFGDLAALLATLRPNKKDHLLVTIFFTVVAGQAVMQTQAEAFQQDDLASPSTSTGTMRNGCPVPPCVKIFAQLSNEEKNDCLRTMSQLLQQL